MRLVVYAVSVIFGLACGGTERVNPAHAGDPNAAPSLHALPAVETLALSRRMRFGMLLAEESLGLGSPVLPEERSAPRLSSWNEQVLRPWLERKQHTVEAARRELDEAAEETHTQRVVAGALVGLLYEDVSETLMRIPEPEEFFGDTEILTIYRDVRDAHASPYREHARRAYEACAANALAHRRFHHWRTFCGERASRLPPSRFQTPVASGATEVTVVRDGY